MSKEIALLGDSVQGTTTGEHNGHTDSYGHPIHSPSTITGTITSGSPNVFINGKPIARAGDSTVESDNCDSGRVGSLRDNGSTVKINGKSVALLGDEINPHNGTAYISSASSGVYVG